MLNSCNFIGNLGDNPEIKTTQSGDEFVNFSIAVNETWKDKNTGEKKERTEWVNVTCFQSGLVGVIKNYVKKGDKVYISGKMQTDKVAQEDGSNKFYTKIMLKDLVMLGGRSEGANSAPIDSHNEAKGNGYQPQPEDNSEAPF